MSIAPAVTLPAVGMGATLGVGSDRYPYTIIEVSASGKSITIQEDDAIRMDKNGPYTEMQTYSFAPNKNGGTYVARLNEHGRWRVGGPTDLMTSTSAPSPTRILTRMTDSARRTPTSWQKTATATTSFTKPTFPSTTTTRRPTMGRTARSNTKRGGVSF